jgi:hypothetical protein
VEISDLAAWCGISFLSDYNSNPLYRAHHLYLNGKEINDLVIPDSVTSIGSNAFYSCTGLTSVTIPNSVTSIGYSAYSYCTSLNSISIPISVTEIREYAFSGCTNLNSIIIPDSVRNIAQGAFSFCTSLNSISIPDYVQDISREAFYKCTSLNSISIPNSVQDIGDNVFWGCARLKSIFVEEKNRYFKHKDGVLFNKGLTKLIKYPASKPGEQYSIPNSVTDIEWGAFFGCTSLNSISIPNSVQDIGYNTFWGCTSLKSIRVEEENPYYEQKDGVLFNKGITKLIKYPAGKPGEQYSIPNSVTEIGPYAFDGCTSLKSIIIASTITRINFKLDSSNLKEIICKAIVPPIIENDYYVKEEIYSTCTLYVPDMSLDDYKCSKYNWSHFRNILPIFKYPTTRIDTENDTEVTDDLLS